MTAKLFHGDGFARILRPSVLSSRVIGFDPLHPHSVNPFRDKGRILYHVSPLDGTPSYTLDSADMLHLPSLGFDGLRSPSPITFAGREAVGTAIAAQEYTGRFFAGGANIDYALKTASRLGDKQLADLKASLMARAQNGGRGPLILSGGLEPAQLSINSKDAEILATKLFNVEEISRILGVPPHMIGHTSKSTSFGTGIEQQGIAFVRYTLQRHLTPICQEVNSKIWPIRQKYFVEHIVAALERADLKSRYEAYRIAMGRAGEQPWMGGDEVRRLENMAPNPNLKMNGGANAHGRVQPLLANEARRRRERRGTPVSPARILIRLKVLVLCCWVPVVRAATLTFDEALAQITLRESLLLGVLMTLAGVTALLFRISNQVNAGSDDKPMKPIRNLPLLVGAHMCGSWLAGICAFFMASHFDMPGLMIGFFVPMVSFGGAKSLELMYNKFVAERLSGAPAAGGTTQ